MTSGVFDHDHPHDLDIEGGDNHQEIELFGYNNLYDLVTEDINNRTSKPGFLPRSEIQRHDIQISCLLR